jgi:hypothetical protein
MAITVELESLTTKSRFVSPTYADRNGTPSVISSELPMPVVDVNHLRLHEGRAYYAYKLYPHASMLPAGASINIAMAFAAGVKAHLVYDANCGGDAEVYLYENAVVSGDTVFTAVRRNRTLATTSQSAILINPTVTSVGTLLDAQFIAGGVGKKSGGGNTFATEQVFSPLTTYLFRLTNVNGTAHMAHLHIEWYE